MSYPSLGELIKEKIAKQREEFAEEFPEEFGLESPKKPAPEFKNYKKPHVMGEHRNLRKLKDDEVSFNGFVMKKTSND